MHCQINGRNLTAISVCPCTFPNQVECCFTKKVQIFSMLGLNPSNSKRLTDVNKMPLIIEKPEMEKISIAYISVKKLVPRTYRMYPLPPKKALYTL